MRKIKEKLGEAHVLLAPPFFWLLIFFVVPLFIVLVFSVGHRGTYGGVRPGFTIQHYKQVLTPLYLKIVWRSFIYALATTVITLLVAYPIAYYMACASARMKTWLMFLVTLPFWTNLLIRLYAFVVILGGGGVVKSVLASLGWGGPLDLLNTATAVLIGFVYWNLPYMILPIFASLDKMDTSLIEASMDLGGHRWTTFRKITVPMSIPGVVAGVVFCFVPTLGNFVIPELLGGADTVMIGNVITLQFLQAKNWPFGSAMSVVLIFAVMILIALYIRFFEPDGQRKDVAA